MKSSLVAFLGLLFCSFTSISAQATSIQWGGRYTVEALRIDNPLLDGQKRGKAYGQHHLVLRPELIPADGFILRGRFDILNSNFYPSTAQGQFFGNGPNGGVPSTSTGQSSAQADSLSSELISVNELYLTWIHDFGALVVGRTPLHFGLGMSYNAGRGSFDHYFDNRDMLAYKMQLGNFFILPMIGKIAEGLPSRNDDITDYMVHAEYENPETGLAIGALYRTRQADSGGNDTPLTLTSVSNPALFEGGLQQTQTSVFIRQRMGAVKMGIEGAFLSGKFGLLAANGDTIRQNGFAVALEVAQADRKGPWGWDVKAGMASGDDPRTANRFEGFFFDRNYDIAFLLFNHPLGNENIDATGTRALRGQGVAGYSKLNDVDTDTVSNVVYFAPRVQYFLNEEISFGGRVTGGYLQKTPTALGGQKDLGYELDLSVQYSPLESFTVMAEAGLLFPGQAFQGGPTDNFENPFTYGLMTKAALSF